MMHVEIAVYRRVKDDNFPWKKSDQSARSGESLIASSLMVICRR